MSSHERNGTTALLKTTVTYMFPERGEYRIFVQVKRAGRVVTGVFDAHVP